MKKFWTVALAATMLSSALTACGGGKDDAGQTNTGGAGGDAKKDVTIRIFQYKVEIAEQLNKLKEEYEKAHPGVKLQIETVGGGADYGAALKAKFAGGEEPDIFNNGGNSELDLWIDKMEDLSGEPWVANMIDSTKAQISRDGKIYGQPIGIEGYGFLYNKELFDKAGITQVPNTLASLEDAAKKLQAAGVATPFANGYQEWWILGIHNMNVALANQPNPDQFIADLKAGKVQLKDNKIFQDWVNLLDLTVKYGSKTALTTDYNTQVTEFATGKAGLMQQGNWTQVQINKTNPDIKIGVAPMPISNEATSKIFTGVPNNWAVNKNSKVKEEAKAFLNWLVSSETGKKYIVNEFKFMPAFKNIEFDAAALGDIAASIQTYTKDNNTLPWLWFKLPDGATQEIGAHMQAYIAGKIQKDQLLTNIQDTIVKLASKK
ncbi:ABC transporter substrate-binding protein [Paenibacillus turpanensis]|uniref:ABC transporter substrate-binding protein n=1 Tax=Paenibacillus turpanensis TaxID=2689078 RepID=UPI001409A9CC|nr:extracellular solute-binding protein [Paenibacillus turpanensis]